MGWGGGGGVEGTPLFVFFCLLKTVSGFPFEKKTFHVKLGGDGGRKFRHSIQHKQHSQRVFQTLLFLIFLSKNCETNFSTLFVTSSQSPLQYAANSSASQFGPCEGVNQLWKVSPAKSFLGIYFPCTKDPPIQGFPHLFLQTADHACRT